MDPCLNWRTMRRCLPIRGPVTASPRSLKAPEPRALSVSGLRAREVIKNRSWPWCGGTGLAMADRLTGPTRDELATVLGALAVAPARNTTAIATAAAPCLGELMRSRLLLTDRSKRPRCCRRPADYAY